METDDAENHRAESRAKNTYDDILEHIVRGIFDFSFVSYSNDIFTFEADLDAIPTVTENGKVSLTIGAVDVNDIKLQNRAGRGTAIMVTAFEDEVVEVEFN